MALTHFDPSGASRMVDVGHKKPTRRMARASAQIAMRDETSKLIQNRELAKGDVLEVARLAGIMATKRTDELIPLCHSLPLDRVDIDCTFTDSQTLRLESRVETFAKTGVEMEALMAVSIAALTVYDMCKAIDRDMQVQQIQLEEKLGGKSGHFLRPQPGQEEQKS